MFCCQGIIGGKIGDLVEVPQHEKMDCSQRLPHLLGNLLYQYRPALYLWGCFTNCRMSGPIWLAVSYRRTSCDSFQPTIIHRYADLHSRRMPAKGCSSLGIARRSAGGNFRGNIRQGPADGKFRWGIYLLKEASLLHLFLAMLPPPTTFACRHFFFQLCVFGTR